MQRQIPTGGAVYVEGLLSLRLPLGGRLIIGPFGHWLRSRSKLFGGYASLSCLQAYLVIQPLTNTGVNRLL